MTSALFEPVQIGALSLRNRVVMAPMSRYFSPGGTPTADVRAYYRRRAEGGAGLVMTEGLEIAHPGSVHRSGIPNFHEPAALEAWAGIATAVQAGGAAFVPQLWHVGGFRSAVPDVTNPHVPALSPSGTYTPGKPYGSPATHDDIAAVIDAFASAAQAAYEMGCDGIDLHGGHGYLFDQFFWHATNQRDDVYGGDVAARTRFACEVVAECRRRTSPTFAIFFRFSQWKMQDYGAKAWTSPDELAEFLSPLVAAGVDVFDCSTRRFWVPEFAGSELNLAGWTQRLSGRPAMTVGSVGLDSDVVQSLQGMEESAGVSSLDRLEEMLHRGDFTLVGVGRALLADADWVRKIKDGDTSSLRGFTRAALDVLV